MATMNVSLPEPMKDWVEDQAKDGRFANSSDYVRHLIRRDQERAEAIARLNAALEEGERSGTAEDFDFDEFLARKRAEAMDQGM
jgi:antitoxin ParD1/3/4